MAWPCNGPRSTIARQSRRHCVVSDVKMLYVWMARGISWWNLQHHVVVQFLAFWRVLDMASDLSPPEQTNLHICSHSMAPSPNVHQRHWHKQWSNCTYAASSALCKTTRMHTCRVDVLSPCLTLEVKSQMDQLEHMPHFVQPIGLGSSWGTGQPILDCLVHGWFGYPHSALRTPSAVKSFFPSRAPTCGWNTNLSATRTMRCLAGVCKPFLLANKFSIQTSKCLCSVSCIALAIAWAPWTLTLLMRHHAKSAVRVSWLWNTGIFQDKIFFHKISGSRFGKNAPWFPYAMCFKISTRGPGFENLEILKICLNSFNPKLPNKLKDFSHYFNYEIECVIILIPIIMIILMLITWLLLLLIITILTIIQILIVNALRGTLEARGPWLQGAHPCIGVELPYA